MAHLPGVLAPGVIQPGAYVYIVGLKGAAELNGLRGVVLKKGKDSERWDVDLGSFGVKALKTENLDAGTPSSFRETHTTSAEDQKPCVTQNNTRLRSGYRAEPSALEPGVLQSGADVCLFGLTGNPHLNGKRGKVLGYDATSARWDVDLGVALGVKSVKSGNLVVCDEAQAEQPSAQRKHQRDNPGPPVETTLLNQADTQNDDSLLENLMPPSQKANDRVDRCLEVLNRMARRLGATCVLFGSWAQRTSLDGSDLDVALLFKGQFEHDTNHGISEKIQLLQCFSAKVLGSDLTVVEEVFGAKVPILRLEYSEDHRSYLEVDLSIGNSRTGELDDYIGEEIARCPQWHCLFRLVKHWATARNINKAVYACLNSLSWTLLLLFFVRTGSPQGSTRASFAAFLVWMEGLCTLPHSKEKLSYREGRWSPRCLEQDTSVLWIEDPTMLTNNTARSLRLAGWKVTLDEVQRALALLRQGSPLSVVCNEAAPCRIHLAPPHLRVQLQLRRDEQNLKRHTNFDEHRPTKMSRNT